MVSPPLGWHGKLKNRGNHSPTPSLPSCVCPVLKIGWRDGNCHGWERGASLIYHPFTPSTLRTLTLALALRALAAWTLGKRRSPLFPISISSLSRNPHARFAPRSMRVTPAPPSSSHYTH